MVNTAAKSQNPYANTVRNNFFRHNRSGVGMEGRGGGQKGRGRTDLDISVLSTAQNHLSTNRQTDRKKDQKDGKKNGDAH